MLIRKNQMDQMSADMMNSFEDRMVEHLNQFFKAKTKPMGEEAVRQSIRDGVGRASGYFVESERDVARFIDLKFALHQEWDTQPEMDWAKKILDDMSLAGEQKMDQIYQELPERLREMSKAAGKR
jgi:hypothetical protein